MPYSLEYRDGWDRHYSKMDKSVQLIIWKKIQQQKNETGMRHMRHGVDFYVVEAGQYRIALKVHEEKQMKEICFAGNHKQYEKWYKEQ